MKRASIALGVGLMSMATLTWAAPPVAKPPQQLQQQPAKTTITISSGNLTPTPEMWFYEQSWLRYQDPKNAIRQRAEFRANQREQRLASMQWYGLSNHRPTSSADLIHGDGVPHWSSGSVAHPMRFNASASPTVISVGDSSGK